MDELIPLLASFLPLPTVALDSIGVPRDGLVVGCPTFCRRAFNKGKCTAHYERLRSVAQSAEPIECPQGFFSSTFNLSGQKYAFTSFIPTPRVGTKRAAERSKKFPENRVSKDRVRLFVDSLAMAELSVSKLLTNELAARLHPLHELRRINSTIKTILERTCRRHSSSDPESAEVDLVRAWKASELISHQLDSLDVYSRPDAVAVIPETLCELYRLVDKVVRIWRPTAAEKGKSVQLKGNCAAKTWVDNGTIHIVPSVLIDNAIKYSPPDGTVIVQVDELFVGERLHIALSVKSIGPLADDSEMEKLFKRRVRGRRAKLVADGTGMGLLLAQKVAQQHHAKITVSQTRIGVDEAHWCFEVKFLAQQSSGTSKRVRTVAPW